ncbi:terpenoid cyclases/protein prenyltransferase alpha-alpha toroid [Mycena floridula]|nr:terpenoid cyclases/protein prenyltransferase alpha-alpha toroid [Mycena floridula]
MVNLPDSASSPFTDYSRWRLLVPSDNVGRHTWHYLTEEECDKWPQNEVDKYWLGMKTGLPELPRAKTPLEAAKNGYTFYKNLQSWDGHWAGEYGGPLFLMPGLVIGSYVSGMDFKPEEKLEMMRYLMNRAHPKTVAGECKHIEGHSTVFGTALNYTVLRLLGMDAEHPVCVKARATLHKLGGAKAAPAWGKFWLSVLNVYDWEGNNPIPPELCLPEWVPFHPHRWWIHTRNVYIPMSYLYAVRFKAKEDDLILSLRQELYSENFYSINWPAQRNNVCKADLYSPHSSVFDMISVVLSIYESCTLPPMRRAGLERAYKLIVMEDENTGYQTIGPVSKMMNLVARAHAEGPESFAYKEHRRKRDDFMWMSGEGMMMTGTNGSQLWDTAFITQALAETGLAELPEYQDSLTKALEWLDKSQMRDNPKHYKTAFRHATKGAWGFSTKEQGYTVSDCTGEGLKSVMYLQELSFTPKLVSERRMCDSVDLMLTLQNPNGGFASYELVRGPRWMELLNPAEVFGDIMIEYCYPECTTSVITSLAIFRKHYPHYRAQDIESTIQKAISYLHNVQSPEGGWLGCWGICFTYATMFALESLSLVGENYHNSQHAKRACEYLLQKQRADGGWGESYQSCEQSAWCWAALALMHAGYPEPEPLEKAVQLVMSRQLPDGSWAQEAIEGVFNKNCAISYPNFKFAFPIWMLGRVGDYLAQLEAKKL